MRSRVGGSGWAEAPRPGGTRAGGFTLLEILLGLALIGLLSAALVSGAIRVIDSRPQRPEDVFWAASHAARRTALQSEHEVALSYDTKERRFVVGGSGAAQHFPIPGATRELTVDLLAGQDRSGNSTVLIGGELVENRTITSVTYYPDGTCAPFRVQFRTNGPARVIAIDPWTCAPMLPRNEARP